MGAEMFASVVKFKPRSCLCVSDLEATYEDEEEDEEEEGEEEGEEGKEGW